MWTDVLVKPLKGQKFRDMLALLLNCPRDYDDDAELKNLMKPPDETSSQECVEEHPSCVSQVTWGPSHINPT